MAQGYQMLGMQELSDNAVTVLAANYPEHPALNASGEFDFDQRLIGSGDSFLGKITFGLIERLQPPAFDSRAIFNRSVREAELIATNEAKKEEPRSIWNRITFGLVD